MARNPLVAMLLQRAEYIEKMGTGIKRIREAIKEAGLKEPKFEYNGFFVVTFSRIKVKKEEIFTIPDKGLSEIERKILELMARNNAITIQSIAGRLNKSKSTILRYVSKLEDVGILRREGSNRRGYWNLSDKNDTENDTEI